MPNITEPLSQGVVTSREPTQLQAGELQQAIGCYYKPSDMRLHKLRGRSAFGDTGSAAKIKGVRLLQFDSGTDQLVALSGTVLYGAPSPGATGTFASLKTGLDSTAERLSAAQYLNRWFLATDGDADRVFVVDSSGSVYDAGMEPYAVPPTVSVSAAGGAVTRPSSPSGTILSAANSVDSDADTFSAIQLSAAGSEVVTWTWSGGTLLGAGTYDVMVKFALQGPGFYGDEPYHRQPKDSTTTGDPGYNVTLKLETSVDNGSSYTTVLNQTTTQAIAPGTFSTSITSTGVACILRATLTYNSGLNQAGWRFYDVRAQTGSATSNFSTTTGFYYACTELDSTTGDRSPAKSVTDLVTLSSQNQVTLTRPTQKNTRATHWEIWRTTDGGTAPYDLGKIGQKLMAETTFKDDFTDWPSTTTGPEKIPMLRVTSDDGGILDFERDQPPPNLDRIYSFKGALLGTKGRSLRYSIGGFPCSWPEVYNVTSFESDEDDNLVSGSNLGELFILGGTANLRRIQSLPRAGVGNLAYSAPEIIAGAPGVVGPYAMAKFSISGEPRVAWISYYGVYVTNGYGVQRISDDWDWSDFETFDKSGWVLHWDAERMVLIVAYSESASAENTRFAFAHMHPSHDKGGQPKWTLGHYGELSDLDSGQVGTQRRLYSGHPDNGIVYLEDNGTTDESQSYSSTTIPLIVQPRRLQSAESEFAVLSAWLRCAAFGASQTLAMSWQVGRDFDESTQTRTATLDVSSSRRVQTDISLGGDWHDVTLTHTGAADGWLGELVVQTRMLGRPGTVQVA